MRAKLILYYNDLVYQPSESFLHKDFGQVPYVLSELHGTDLEYWIAAEHPNPGFDRFRGRRVRQFGKRRRRLLPARLDALRNRDLLRALDRDDYTHLLIFPFTPATDLVVARRAKRRGARIILKLDTNVEHLSALEASWRRRAGSPIRRLTQAHHYRELLRLADAVICETRASATLLREGFLDIDLSDRLVTAFSGISERWFADLAVPDVSDAARDRSIVVSGRISSAQKHTETVLAAGPPPDGWRIDFIGEVDERLASVIARYRATDPAFDERYRFHGAITDKRAYFELLMRARVLLLNSRGGEGFPNVFAEAHRCRLTIVASDVSGAADATGGGRWGIIYRPDDADALRDVLATLPDRLAALPPVPGEYRRRFIWEHSLDQPAIARLFAEAA